jgi:hypothetical protein
MMDSGILVFWFMSALALVIVVYGMKIRWSRIIIPKHRLTRMIFSVSVVVLIATAGIHLIWDIEVDGATLPWIATVPVLLCLWASALAEIWQKKRESQPVKSSQ